MGRLRLSTLHRQRAAMHDLRLAQLESRKRGSQTGRHPLGCRGRQGRREALIQPERNHPMIFGEINLIDITVVLLYVFATAYLGYLGYRGTRTTSDYLVAGRKAHPMVMALSYGATFISTSAIVGFGGVAANLGMGLLWLTVLNIFVGIFIAFVFLGNPTRRMGHHLDAHTFPEPMGKRYNSRFLQVACALIIFVF